MKRHPRGMPFFRIELMSKAIAALGLFGNNLEGPQLKIRIQNRLLNAVEFISAAADRNHGSNFIIVIANNHIPLGKHDRAL